MTIWQNLETEIQSQTYTKTAGPFKIDNKTVVTGGDINQAYCLSSGQTQYFVKLNTGNCAEMFQREAEGLEALRQPDVIKVPEVITHGQFEQYGYLVLSYIPMQQRGNIADFATALAKLHLQTQSQFGFHHNNYIGRTPQINDWSDDWGEFFAEHRINYLLKLLDKRVPAGLIQKGRLLLPKLSRYLNQHAPKPALVHGDLWQGNYSFDQQGEPLIYDPACYYGDHEVDLAMLELFGHPGEAFFTTYNKINPIDSGYAQRKHIYNLYHLLNHATLFGSSYVQQSEFIIDQLLDQL